MLPTIRRSRPAWDAPLHLLHDDFDRVLSRWFGDDPGTTVGAYPVNIREDENNLYVEAEMPGFRKEDIEVTFENGILTLAAERKDEEQKGQPHLQERRFTRVARSFTLPNTVDDSKIDARLDNGVLYLTLTKREEVKHRKIAVK